MRSASIKAFLDSWSAEYLGLITMRAPGRSISLGTSGRRYAATEFAPRVGVNLEGTGPTTRASPAHASRAIPAIRLTECVSNDAICGSFNSLDRR